MFKPPSIAAFERYWWGSAALALVSAVLSWERVRRGILSSFAADPRFRNNATATTVAEWAQPTNIALMLAWTALTWFLVVRAQRGAGRVLAIVSAVLGGLQLLILFGGLVLGRAFHPLSQLSSIGAAVLAILAAVALFRSDAAAWFGEFEAEEEKA